jgi:hypothetical protein
MPELPNDPGLATADGASSPEPSWQNRVRTIFRRRSVKSALVVAAIAISGSSGYLAYHSKAQRALEAQSRNDRPRIAIINAAIEAIDQENLNLKLKIANVAAKTAYSLVIAVVGFNPTTERGRQLATIAGTKPLRSDIAFVSNASINLAEMLPVVVLCMLYADDSKRGFTEHLYYDASEKPRIDQPVELRKLSRDEHRRVDDSKVCRL